MKPSLYLSVLILALTACGQQEKSDDPFKRTGNEQVNPGLTEKAFKDTCARKKGSLVQGDTICTFTSLAKIYADGEAVDKEFGENTGFKMITLKESVPEGAKLYGDVKGGQVITFFVNGNSVGNMAEPYLAPRNIPGGKLEMRLYRGHYEYLNVFVDECFSRTAAGVPCPL